MGKLSEEIRFNRNRLGLTQGQLAELVGYGQTTVSDWEKGKITQIRNTARVAQVLGIPLDYFERLLAEEVDRDQNLQRISPKIRETMKRTKTLPVDSEHPEAQSRITVRQSAMFGARDVPVYGRAQGGEEGVFEFNGEIMGWETRPPVLDGVPGAYALYVDGTSMYPRYKTGETVWINPNKPPKRGDDVVIQIKRPDGELSVTYGFIKEFVSWSGSFLVVCQHNPSMELKYPKETVESVHTIVYAQRS